MSLGIGGAETHVVSLATHLKALGWDVHVASGGGDLVRYLDEAGVEHVAAPLGSRSPVSMALAYRTVRDLIAGRKIGLVHAHARIPAWIAGRICESRGIPMVTTYHGTFVSGAFWNFFTRPGDRTIAVSDDIRDHVIREFGFLPEKVTVILNGIDLHVFRAPGPSDREAGRKRLRVPPWASHVVLYESRLDGDLVKVAQAMVDAALILRAKYPGLHLLVAGDGVGIGRVREHASRANRSSGKETVRCTGYLTETFFAYAASDLVVGMSRVALEAMASERPVVVAGPGGVCGPVRPGVEDELEERNYTSRNAPYPLSSGRLAEEIGPLLADPAARQDLGRFGRQTVAARHSMEQVTAKTERVYAEVLQGTRR
jgi:glycosyltransferase involved in cell wall biosynthesis